MQKLIALRQTAPEIWRLEVDIPKTLFSSSPHLRSRPSTKIPLDRDPIAKSLSNDENSTESNKIWTGSKPSTVPTLCKSSSLYVKRFASYSVSKSTFRRHQNRQQQLQFQPSLERWKRSQSTPKPFLPSCVCSATLKGPS